MFCTIFLSLFIFFSFISIIIIMFCDLFQLKLFTCMKENLLVVKGEIIANVTAKHAYGYLLDEKKRVDWDDMVM